MVFQIHTSNLTNAGGNVQQRVLKVGEAGRLFHFIGHTRNATGN
jgi:hypothetical protein